MKTRTRAMGVAVVGVVLLLAGAALASPEATTLDRSVIAGGGGRVEAGASILEGTIGQPVVGRASAGVVQLDAGFWPGARGSSYRIYLPLVLRAPAY
jgi:hypothetical protein